MAMLSETRRKQKWTLNPRGKHWSEDQNKFGQKMLEKMGWTNGKGLGAQEQGMTEHIRVKFKDNQAGIGFNKNDYDNNWIENQSGFNDFLLQLQQQNSNVHEVKDNENKGLSGKSLEQISENSRARVHYKKFTRGKDVNKYNNKDLANIFGKKDIHEKYIPVKEKTKFEDNMLDPIGTEDHRGGIVTVKGGNINDYFKNKLFSVSSICNTSEIKEEQPDSESEMEQRTGFGFISSFSMNEKEINVEYEKKNFQPMSVTQITERLKNKKLKNKSKIKEITIENKQDFVFDNPCLLDVNEIDDTSENIEITTPAKKLKKDKRNKKHKINEHCIKGKYQENITNNEVNSINADELIENLQPKKKSKKEKRAKNDDTEVTKFSSEENREKSEFVFDNPCLMDVNEIDNEMSQILKKKKLKYKQKTLNENNTNNVIETEEKAIEVIDLTQTFTKKKKSKIEHELHFNDSVTISNNKNEDENNFAFNNSYLLDINKIDNGIKNLKKNTKNNEREITKLECDNVCVKKKKEKNNVKKENMYLAENPFLLDITKNNTQSELQIEKPNKKKKSKKSKSEIENNDCDFAFENPCLQDVNEIDKEGEKQKKTKKSKISKICVTEITDNSKNEELEEKNNFAFGNPCLGDIQVIDDEAQKSKKRKRNLDEVTDLSLLSKATKKQKKVKTNQENEICMISNVTNCNGSEYEVPRKHFGLVNSGLDLTDEVPGKKRVIFNDKIEYNTDAENNKKGKNKLDKYEVENVIKKKKNTKRKILHTKKELKSFFLMNPVLEFTGSNVNDLKGYGCE